MMIMMHFENDTIIIIIIVDTFENLLDKTHNKKLAIKG
jgi:hypothetical protein